MKTYIDMTNEEIEFIIKYLFQTDAKEDIERIERFKTHILVEMESFEGMEKLCDNDHFVIKSNEIIPWDFTDHNILKKNDIYQKYLFAKGYHWIDKDNEFMEDKNE